MSRASRARRATKVLVSGSLRHLKDEPPAAAEAHARLPPRKTQVAAPPGLSLQAESLIRAAEELGIALAKSGYSLIVGSHDPIDVDPYVVEAFLSVADAQKPVEVRLIRHAEYQFPDRRQGIEVKNIPARFDDWDVSVLDYLGDDEQDIAVIVVGGRQGAVQAGVAGWKLGRAVIPISAFGGGGAKVWDYGSADRSRFYFDGLSHDEIDGLRLEWLHDGEVASADEVCRVLGNVLKARERWKRPPWIERLAMTLVAAASLALWMYLLIRPLVDLGFDPLFTLHGNGGRLIPEQLFGNLVLSVCAAGLVGTTISSLHDIVRGLPLRFLAFLPRTMLGVCVGFVASMLYLVANVVLVGAFNLPDDNQSFLRMALTAGLPALFGSMYVDATFAWLDGIKDSVISGEYFKKKSG